jgi:hypothetical protein
VSPIHDDGAAEPRIVSDDRVVTHDRVRAYHRAAAHAGVVSYERGPLDPSGRLDLRVVPDPHLRPQLETG